MSRLPRFLSRAADASSPVGKLPRVLGPADPWLAAAIIGLVAFGVVMVYSSSAVFAAQRYGNSLHFLIRQSIYAGLGGAVLFGVARIDYHRYRVLTYPALAVCVVMMLFVAVGFGRSAGGAARWIALGPINIQPAEPTKVALILWLAYSLSKKAGRMRNFSVGFLPHVLMAGLLMLLCLMHRDFGSAAMMGALTFVLLFSAGARIKDLFGGVMIVVPAAAAAVLLSPYRMRRIEAFLSPFEYSDTIGYQLSKAIMGFGAGGLTGVGIGDSRQKLLFLPEAHTDFISAIIGEEFGFVGVVALVLAFSFIVYRGLRAAAYAPDDYGTYLATGVAVFIGLQAMTNLGVATGLLPTKGLVLPFLSYGGSSLLVNCAAAGLLLNISRPRKPFAFRLSESEREGVVDGKLERPSQPLEARPSRASKKRSFTQNTRSEESIRPPDGRAQKESRTA